MFIISNYTINLIAYRGKYHPCVIEAATMGSRLTTCAYYLIVLGVGHSVCSREIASSDSLTNRAQSSSALCKGMRSLIALVAARTNRVGPGCILRTASKAVRVLPDFEVPITSRNCSVWKASSNLASIFGLAQRPILVEQQLPHLIQICLQRFVLGSLLRRKPCGSVLRSSKQVSSYR